MGTQGTLINPKIEAQARGLMALDFLCPEPSHRWARLHLAVAHWHRLDPDPKVHSQGKLAGKIKNIKTGKCISATQLSGARMPPTKNRRDGCGLDDDKLKQAAAIIDVDPDWLIAGYSARGLDVWPAWTVELTARWRSVILQIGRAYLLKIIEWEREGTLPKQRKMSCVPHVVIEHAELSDIGPMVPGIVPSPEHGFPREITRIRDYLVRQGVDFEDYLQRFSGLIGSDFAQLRQDALQHPVTRRKSPGGLPKVFALGLRQKSRLGTAMLLKDEIAAHLDDQERIVTWFASRIGTCPASTSRSS